MIDYWLSRKVPSINRYQQFSVFFFCDSDYVRLIAGLNRERRLKIFDIFESQNIIWRNRAEHVFCSAIFTMKSESQPVPLPKDVHDVTKTVETFTAVKRHLFSRVFNLKCEN